MDPVDLPRIESAVREILAAIGEDPDRDGLVETPARVARAMLERSPGGAVVHNCICSRTVPEVIRESGGTPVRTCTPRSSLACARTPSSICR